MPGKRQQSHDSDSLLERGLSMVEILVSIAIVAVLSILISAVLIRTKSSARVASCMQNLRQIGLASELYSNDVDGNFIPFGTHIPNTVLQESGVDILSQGKAWKRELGRYGVARGQFFCPDDPYTNPQSADSLMPMRPQSEHTHGSARLLTSYAVVHAVYFRSIGYSRSSVDSPSERPYATDGVVEVKGGLATDNHGVRLNVLHIDGSVKSYSSTHTFPALLRPRP